MRMARLELARLTPHAPQACVSTDSTTSAYAIQAIFAVNQTKAAS